MKTYALALLCCTFFGCTISDTPYLKWHKLQGELIKINDEQNAICGQHKPPQVWGFAQGTGPMCIDPQPQQIQQPAAVKK